MKAVVQRVNRASVNVEGRLVGEIGQGLLVLLGIHRNDTEKDAEWIARKIPALRIFDDDTGAMNQSVRDTDGEVLVISQFTLLGTSRKGTRPSYNDAARPETAVPLYEKVVEIISEEIGKPVPTGEFGAMMSVELVNDGPVTIILDTHNKGTR